MQKPKIKITVIGRKGPSAATAGINRATALILTRNAASCAQWRCMLPFPISTFCATAVQFPVQNPARQYFAAPMSIPLTFLRLKW